MKTILFSMITAFLLTSCGRNGHITYYIPPSNYFTPDFLSLEDPSCQTDSKRNRLHLNYGEQRVHRFAYGNYEYTKVNYSNDSIVSDVLIPSGAYVGNIKENNLNDREIADDISQFKKIYLCPDYANFGHYQDRSLEMVALTSLASINESYEFYKQITNNNILEKYKLKLLIHPNISTNDNVGYYTDNAFYYDVKNFSDIIAVIPHSLELPPFIDSHLSFIGFIPFWEQQIILSHEFGHFVFENHSHISGAKGRMADSLSDAAGKSKSPKYLVLREIYKSSLHEAFADLFGVLVSHANTRSFYAMDPEQRDIFNSKFQLGDKVYTKKLTKSIIQTAELQEGHVLGAFLAYGIYHSLNHFFPGDNITKGKILIEWANQINLSSPDNIFNVYSSETAFIKILKIFEKTLSNHQKTGTVSYQTKDILQKYLPIIFE